LFSLNQADTGEDIQDITTIVRTIAEMDAAPDTEEKTLAMGGTADQLALGEWIVNQVDRIDPARHESAKFDYQAGGRDSVVRVFRLSDVETGPGLEEIHGAIRAIGDVPRVAIHQGKHVVVVRGTADQIALSEWLVNRLDQRAPRGGAPAAYDFRADPRDPAIRVFRLAQAETPPGVYAIGDVLRAVMDVRHLALDEASSSVVMRGTADQAQMAEWLVNQMEQPGPPRHESAKFDYQAGGRDSVVQVFRLAHVDTEAGLQEINGAFRAIADISRSIPCAAQQALVARGTADRMAVAEWLVNQLDQPVDSKSALQRLEAARFESPVPGDDRQAVCVIHFANATKDVRMADITAQARIVAKVTASALCHARKALCVRGTDVQIDAVEQLMRGADKR
jgi:limonene-1,2-epoxide hydrolase